MKRLAAPASLAALFVLGASGLAAAEPALIAQTKKLALVAELRSATLASVEAEKSAVLATSESESKAFAAESKGLAAEAERAHAALRDLVVAGERAPEVEKLAALDDAWTKLRTVDARLLDLAVTDTNLKAMRLAGTDGAAALDRTVTAIGDMERASSNPGVLRDLSAAAISTLLIQTVLLRHIPALDEGEMSLFEGRIDELAERVDHILADLAKEETVPSDLSAAASREWVEYGRILAEVLSLSRENSDLISSDVAVHGKREAMRRCLDALAALETAIEAVPQATR